MNNENNDYDKNTNEASQYNNDELAVYWYNFHIKNDTYYVRNATQYVCTSTSP